MPDLAVRPVVYGSPTTIQVPGGEFNETVRPGALTRALARPDLDVIAVRDHDVGRLLARTSSGTLKLEDRPLGLDARISVPDTELGRETIELVERGDLAGASFRFGVSQERWYEDARGRLTREIVEVDRLADISVCTLPAYTKTSVRVIRSHAPSVAAQSRQLDLDLVELEIGDELRRVTYGRRIPRPSWVMQRTIQRGCGHTA